MLDLRPAQGPRLALQLASRDNHLDVHVVESPVGEAEVRSIKQVPSPLGEGI